MSDDPEDGFELSCVRTGTFWQRQACKTLVVLSEVAPVGQSEDSYALVVLSDPNGYGTTGTFYSDPTDSLEALTHYLNRHGFARLEPPFTIPVFAWADRPEFSISPRRVSGVGKGHRQIPAGADLSGKPAGQ